MSPAPSHSSTLFTRWVDLVSTYGRESIRCQAFLEANKDDADLIYLITLSDSLKGILVKTD